MAFSQAERRVVSQASVAHALTHLYMLAFPAMVMPLVRDTGASVPEVIEKAFLGFLLFGLGALPAGWMADRLTARVALGVCMIAAGAASCVCALAPDLAWLAALHGLLGLAASIYHPAGMALITRTVRQRGAALAVNGMIGNVGLALSPLVVGLVATTVGWRTAWVVIGIPGVLVGAWILAAPSDEAVVPITDSGLDGGRPMSLFAVLCVAMALAGLAFQGTTVAMPAFFEQRVTFLAELLAPLEGIAPGGAGTVGATGLASAAYLVAIGGQWMGGQIADRWDLRKGFIVLHLAAAPFAAASYWAADWAVPFAIFGYTFFQLGMQPVENSLVAELSPSRLRASAYGLKFVLSFGVGALAVPAVAAIEGAWDLSAVYLFVAAASAANAGIAVLLLMLSRRPPPA